MYMVAFNGGGGGYGGWEASGWGGYDWGGGGVEGGGWSYDFGGGIQDYGGGVDYGSDYFGGRDFTGVDVGQIDSDVDTLAANDFTTGDTVIDSVGTDTIDTTDTTADTTGDTVGSDTAGSGSDTVTVNIDTTDTDEDVGANDDSAGVDVDVTDDTGEDSAGTPNVGDDTGEDTSVGGTGDDTQEDDTQPRVPQPGDPDWDEYLKKQNAEDTARDQEGSPNSDNPARITVTEKRPTDEDTGEDASGEDTTTGSTGDDTTTPPIKRSSWGGGVPKSKKSGGGTKSTPPRAQATSGSNFSWFLNRDAGDPSGKKLSRRSNPYTPVYGGWASENGRPSIDWRPQMRNMPPIELLDEENGIINRGIGRGRG